MTKPQKRKAHAKNNTVEMFEFLVLSGMKRSGGEFVDAPTIVHAIWRYAQMDLPLGSVYVVLRRLENAECVWMTKEDRARGESRHYYTMTDAGYAQQAAMLGRIMALGG